MALLMAVATALFAGNNFASGASRPAATKLVTINMGVNPFSGLAATWLGQVKGIFRHYGINVVFNDNSSLSVIIAEVQSGQIQVGYSSMAVLINAINSGINIECVAPVENVEEPIKGYPQGAIVVAKNSPITSLSQLSNKTLALPLLAGIDYLIAKDVVTSAGVNFSSVQPLVLPFSDMTAALQSGEIAAAEEISPYIEEGISAGQIRVLDDVSGVNAGETGQCYFASDSYVNTHRALMTRFVEAQDQAILFAAAHPGEANAQIPTVSGVPASALAGTLPPTVTYSDKLNPVSISKYQHFMAQWGGLDGKSEILVSRIVWLAPDTPMTSLLFGPSGRYLGSSTSKK
jgi:NitT/TauT family transport system substrate-binding protein